MRTKLRIPYVRVRNEGWVEKNAVRELGPILHISPGRHRFTLCFERFAAYFRVPLSVKEIDIVISTVKPRGFDEYGYIMAYFGNTGPYHPLYEAAIRCLNYRDEWKPVPLTPATHDFFIQKLSYDLDVRPGRKVYVWVEHD